VFAFGIASGCRPSKAEFLARVEPKIVALLCDRDRPASELPIYYRNCFDVDEAGCTAVMRRTVHACALQIDVGDLDESAAVKFGERVGACAATEYERELDREGKSIRSRPCEMARDAYAKVRAEVEQP
jgi:hypothetical protein